MKLCILLAFVLSMVVSHEAPRLRTSRDEMGSGKHHTIPPTPTPPTRAHVNCIHDCDANNQEGEKRALCHASCPLAPINMSLVTPLWQASYYAEGNAAAGGAHNALAERIDVTPEQQRIRNARRQQVQTCVAQCVEIASGSKTRSQCRTQCTGSELVGPGKHHTLGPTPTPPTRNHVDCIHDCDAINGGAQCHAGCPPAPVDMAVE